MKDRIALIRSHIKLSQETFGKRIGISGASVSKLESGENNPSEQTLKLICREFGVSYIWITTGEGPMYVPDESILMQNISRIMHGDNEFARRVMREFASMPAEAWAELEAFIDRLAGKEEK